MLSTWKGIRSNVDAGQIERWRQRLQSMAKLAKLCTLNLQITGNKRPKSLGYSRRIVKSWIVSSQRATTEESFPWSPSLVLRVLIDNPGVSAKLKFRNESLKTNLVYVQMDNWITLKRVEKIIPQNAFQQKKKKPGLKFNPGPTLGYR